MKELYIIIKQELQENENIWITTKTKLDDLKDNEWYKFEEYTIDQVFNTYSGNEKVLRYWHEDGLCIILQK